MHGTSAVEPAHGVDAGDLILERREMRVPHDASEGRQQTLDAHAELTMLKDSTRVDELVDPRSELLTTRLQNCGGARQHNFKSRPTTLSVIPQETTERGESQRLLQRNLFRTPRPTRQKASNLYRPLHEAIKSAVVTLD